MIRNCVKWPLDSFIKENKASLIGLQLINVELFYDEKNKKEILAFLQLKDHRKRFRQIIIHVLQNRYNNEIYRREGNDITAMKFGGSSNPRIYCKEIFLGVQLGKKVVMIYLRHNKDFQKASNKKIKGKLQSINDYEYSFK